MVAELSRTWWWNPGNKISYGRVTDLLNICTPKYKRFKNYQELPTLGPRSALKTVQTHANLKERFQKKTKKQYENFQV
mgnify:CR=1 FL=1